MSWREDLTDTEYFECDCGDMDHILRVSYFKDEPEEMYVEIHLRQKTFLRRLWQAVKYAFGFRSRFGDFDEFLWRPETAKEYRAFIDRFLEAREKYWDEKENAVSSGSTQVD